MSQEEINEGNVLIAKFMGAQPCERGHKDCYHFGSFLHWKAEEFPYYEDWGKLMTVVEKIAEHRYEDGDYVYPRTFGMKDEFGRPMFRFNRYPLFHGKTFREACWYAVVDYIKSKNQIQNEQQNHLQC
jgi:hypothetical protein